MSKQNNYGTQSHLTRLELSNKPTLIITEKLQRQIEYLHNQVGKREWSGELITSEKGCITELDNWEVTAEDIFLADVGNSVFTGYQVDQGGFKSVDIVQMYDSFPGLLEGTKRNQHIHTHHDMDTFFSGTDWSQLEDRGVLCNYFIMLIVNFKGEYKAKVAFKGKKKHQSAPVIEFANNADGFSPMKMGKGEESDVLVVMDMNIVYPAPIQHMVPLNTEVREVMQVLSEAEQAQEEHLAILLEYLKNAVDKKVYLVDEPFRVRYESVVNAIEEEKKNKSFNNNSNYGYGQQGSLYNTHSGWNNYRQDDDRNWDGFREKHVRGKKIADMTDKEFQESEAEPKKWDSRDVKALLNATLSTSWWMDYVTDPVVELKKLQGKLKRKEDRTEWLDEFMTDLSPKVTQLWPDADSQDVHALLGLCLTYLDKSQKVPLIKSLCECIEDERTELMEEIIYYNKY